MKCIPLFPPVPDAQRVEVVFGAPTKDCRHVGICRIHLIEKTPKNKACDCNKAKAVLHIVNERQIEFYFLRHSISPDDYQKHFRNSCFRLRESYLFPNHLAKQLGLEYGLQIAAGTYTVAHLGSHLGLKLPLSKVEINHLKVAYYNQFLHAL